MMPHTLPVQDRGPHALFTIHTSQAQLCSGGVLPTEAGTPSPTTYHSHRGTPEDLI